MHFLEQFLHADLTFLEIGAGDCALSYAVAKRVKHVYAVDVCEQYQQHPSPPPNVQWLLAKGGNLPLPPHSVDLAYSHQLLEHLHPDDAVEHLDNVLRVLAPGGRYLCLTPNRLGGPWDISRDFDLVATGLHLKEYTLGELGRQFRDAGFVRLRAYLRLKGQYLSAPLWPLRLCENMLERFPPRLRKGLVARVPMRMLLDIRLVGAKPH